MRHHPSGTVRAAVSRSRQVAGDVQSLEIRAGALAHEVIALEARSAAISGYLDTAPLAGARRYSEAAGVAVGAAVARTRDAGPEDLARAVRDTARARGSAQQIETLLDLAAAALSWATVLSLSDMERSAAMPTKAHGVPFRDTLASPNPGRRPVSKAAQALAAGELRATAVLLGVCSSAQRRQLSVMPVGRLLSSDPHTRDLVAGTYLEQMDTPVGLLSPEERHDMVTDLVRAREGQVAA